MVSPFSGLIYLTIFSHKITYFSLLKKYNLHAEKHSLQTRKAIDPQNNPPLKKYNPVEIPAERLFSTGLARIFSKGDLHKQVVPVPFSWGIQLAVSHRYQPKKPSSLAWSKSTKMVVPSGVRLGLLLANNLFISSVISCLSNICPTGRAALRERERAIK